jgi:hypothetical protein
MSTPTREQVMTVFDENIHTHGHCNNDQTCDIVARTKLARTAVAAIYDECARLSARINAPEIDAFLRAVHVEAVHQVERWGTSHDRAKRPADWFWLVGYLAGKALQSNTSGDTDKALHHTISTAAALYNWHCAIKGTDVSMCPGRSDLAQLVDQQFPNTDTGTEPSDAEGGG